MCVMHVCGRTHALRTCVRTYAKTRKPVCVCVTDAPPSAFGRVSGARACALYSILSPSRLFLSNFFECMSEHIKKDKTFTLYVTAYNIAIRESRSNDLLKANACEILSKIGALGNRAPYD